jgi:AcrR family transcriptional regulator
MRTPYTSVPLDRERVLDAALLVAESEGLERLSMRLLAQQLDVSTMALYRHVANKDDLLDGLVGRLLSELRLPEESLPWEERLRTLAREMRALANRRPELFVLLLGRRALAPGATGAREVALEALRESGLDEQTAGRYERLLSTMVMGFAFSEAAGRFEGVDVESEFNAALGLLAEIVSRR